MSDATTGSRTEASPEVKPGANAAFPAVTKKPDWTLEANRVNVGCGDVTP